MHKNQSGIWLKCIVGILIPFFSATLRITFLGELGMKAPYLTFYPAVIVAALYGGLSSGIISTIISALLASYFWIEPTRQIYIKYSSDWLSMTIFFMSCIMISCVSEAMHRAQQRLELRTRELLEARDEADKANNAKSLFLANMSHELRTPLNAILGYSQLLKRSDSLAFEEIGYLNIINRSGEHLLNLINEVLEIAKIEAKHMKLELASFDIPNMINEVEAMFKVRTDSKGLEFNIIGVNEVPQYVTGDETKLRAILINLLGNAIKFTDKGSITLRITTKKKDLDKITLHMEVEDTGIGIDRTEIGKLFSDFEQTESGRLNKSGTGLGLAISQNYVKLMGGEIKVNSSRDKGSLFYFEIDVNEVTAGDLAAKSQLRHVIGLDGQQCVPRILVVEDIQENRELLVKLLQIVGFKVESAVNGKEAVEIFQQWKPEFIWMDIRMPVMNGLEATRIIRTSEAGKKVKIVALTAHALDDEKEKILEAGCDDFVRKPYMENQIFAIMGKHLGIEYSYSEDEKIEGLVVQLSELTAMQLKNIPDNIISELQEATLKLNTDSISILVEQVREIDGLVGDNLKMLTNNMDYEGLLSTIEEIKERKARNYECT